ncbi:MAG: IS630 transposase-related protein [Dehalococcoidales bacterium]
MSYDVKFRKAALAYWANGHSKIETAQTFSVSHTTLQTWKNRLSETGSVEKKIRNTPWKKIDPVKLVEYVELHPDAFLKEIAEVFGCSDTAIMKALRRLKYTRKKNHGIQRSK